MLQNTSIKVKVLVGCVVEKSCKVSFSETSIEVKFQTRSVVCVCVCVWGGGGGGGVGK